MIRPNAHIAAMAPYALAAVNRAPGPMPLSLSQNESLRPPSPRAVEAAAEVLAQAALYPDPAWSDLRAALAQLHDIPEEAILCGAGSLDLIAALARVYAGPDRAVLAPAHAYPFFRTAAEMAGARFDTAPETDWTADVDRLLAAVRKDTAIVFLANPANPTGTRLPASEIKRLRADMPAHVLLVIDEAYGEFTDHLNAPMWSFTETGNCVILRTFSKAYGLAGARVGWGLFPTDIAADLRKVLNPNGVSAAAQAAALAAVADQAYMRETCQITTAVRARTIARLQDAAFHVVPSHTNFVLLDLGQANPAEDLCNHLAARGIILRRQQSAGVPQAVRMTLGSAAQMDKAIAELIDWKSGASR